MKKKNTTTHRQIVSLSERQRIIINNFLLKVLIKRIFIGTYNIGTYKVHTNRYTYIYPHRPVAYNIVSTFLEPNTH